MPENADVEAEVDVPADEPVAQPADRSFSQADLDRIVKDRLARQRAQFADYDEIKTKLGEIEQASKSELEKAQDRATEFEKQAKDASIRAQEALLRAAVVAEASKKHVVDPDAAFTLLDRQLLKFDEQGEPTNISDAVDSLLADKPFLAGNKTTGSADLGARAGNTPGQLSRDDLQKMSSAEIVKAQADGRLSDLLAGS